MFCLNFGVVLRILLLKFVTNFLRFKAKHLWGTLRGHKLVETIELELLLKETIKLYNKAIAQKGKGENWIDAIVTKVYG